MKKKINKEESWTTTYTTSTTSSTSTTTTVPYQFMERMKIEEGWLDKFWKWWRTH